MGQLWEGPNAVVEMITEDWDRTVRGNRETIEMMSGERPVTPRERAEFGAAIGARGKPAAEAADGKVRKRPYVGRHVEKGPPAPSPGLTMEERIAFLLTGARQARKNAHILRKLGKLEGMRSAFFRAHSYIEMVRELRSENVSS